MRIFMAMVVAAAGTWLSACAGGDSSGSTSSSSGSSSGNPSCDARGFDASASCVQPCAVGNERGVGEFCTLQGGQCDDNDEEHGTGAAIFCTVDFEPTSEMFCTKSCSQDSQCGAGARCAGNPDGGGQKGCVPSSC